MSPPPRLSKLWNAVIDLVSWARHSMCTLAIVWAAGACQVVPTDLESGDDQSLPVATEGRAASVGGRHNDAMRRAAVFSRAAFASARDDGERLELLRSTALHVLRGTIALPDLEAIVDQTLTELIHRDGPSGRFFSVRDRLSRPPLPVANTLYPSSEVQAFSSELVDRLSELDAAQVDTLQSKESVHAQVGSIEALALGSTTLAAHELGLLLDAANVADSSLQYWYDEAVASEAGGGEWEGWPKEQEWETAPPNLISSQGPWPVVWGIIGRQILKVAFSDGRAYIFTMVGMGMCDRCWTLETIKNTSLSAAVTASLYAVFQ